MTNLRAELVVDNDIPSPPVAYSPSCIVKSEVFWVNRSETVKIQTDQWVLDKKAEMYPYFPRVTLSDVPSQHWQWNKYLHRLNWVSTQNQSISCRWRLSTLAFCSLKPSLALKSRQITGNLFLTKYVIYSCGSYRTDTLGALSPRCVWSMHFRDRECVTFG
jgi:hypothetical protein